MTPPDEFPIARRAVGTAIVTGSMGAGLAMSLARPMMHEAIDIAYEAVADLRKASLEGARSGLSSARQAGGPGLKSAMDAKDRLRRRALGTLPPGLGAAAEEMRRQFIEAEKSVYYGSIKYAEDLEPALEVARLRTKNLLVEAVRAFEDVADVALATSIKFGEEVQTGELGKAAGVRAGPKKTKRPTKKRAPARRK
jgi:hypothetical protein